MTVNAKECINSIGERALRFSPQNSLLTEGRSILALSQISILLFTSIDNLFPAVGTDPYGPKCSGIQKASLFCLGGGDNLNLYKMVALAVLSLVVIGYRPRYTCFLHFWVTFSISGSITLPDGGESVARIATLLIIPSCLADNRRFSWSGNKGEPSVFLTSISWSSVIALRIQLSFIYLHSAISKFGVENWADGSAEYYIVRSEMFGSAGFMQSAMQFVTSVPFFTICLTWGALLIELAIGITLLGPRRSRALALVMDIILHVGIILAMGLWSFALVMVASVMAAAGPVGARNENNHHRKQWHLEECG